MKTRIQRAGGKFGDKEGTIWDGNMPMFSGVTGMKIVIIDNDKDEVHDYTFKQLCLEIVKGSEDEAEQVIYVVSRTPDKLLG